MSKGTLSGWLFFWIFLFRRFSDCQQKLSVHVLVKCLQVVKTTICLFRGFFWRFSIFIFFEGIFSCFLKSFELWEVLFTKLYLTYPDEQLDYFFLELPILWIFQSSTRTKSDFWHRNSQVVRTANYVFRESFEGIKLYVLIGFFSFQKFWEFEQVFLAFLDRRTEEGC